MASLNPKKSLDLKDIFPLYPKRGGLKGSNKMLLMGSEVDNFLKFLSKHKMQRKTLNCTFKILSHQDQIILSSSMNEKRYLQEFVEGVLEAIQVSSL